MTNHATPTQEIRYVPVPPDLKDKHGNHPNDTVPFDQGCRDALDKRGDNEGQGLDGYWKWGFREGWRAAKDSLCATPTQDSQPTDLHWHEMLDRAGQMQHFFATSISDHSCAPLLEKEIETAANALGALYQAVGIKRFNVAPEQAGSVPEPERKPPCGIEFEGPSCSIQNVKGER